MLEGTENEIYGWLKGPVSLVSLLTVPACTTHFDAS